MPNPILIGDWAGCVTPGTALSTHASRRSAAANNELGLFIKSSQDGVTAHGRLSVKLRLTETGSIRKKNFAPLIHGCDHHLSALTCTVRL
jgi:hypothetical protein